MRHAIRLARVALSLCGALLSAAPSLAQELIGPEKLSSWKWDYTLTGRTLEIRTCGRFRPGDADSCASATIKGGAKVDRVLALLRIPRERLGIGIEPGGRDFKITHFTHELLSAPGIGEKAAHGRSVDLSGESLTHVLWIQSIEAVQVTVKVCAKLANPEYVGCAAIDEKTPQGIRRLRGLLSQMPVDQLEFRLGWDGAARKFTEVIRIGAPQQ